MNSIVRENDDREKLIVFSIYKYFDFGGLQLDMRRLALELVRRGFRVLVFCQSWEAPPPPSGIRFQVVAPRGWSNHRRAVNFQSDLKELLRKMEFRCHVAFNPVAFADWYYDGDMPFGWQYSCNGWRQLFSVRCRTFHRLEREVFTGTAGIMTITDLQEKNLREKYAVADTRFVRIPPGIDESYREALQMRETMRLRRRELNLTDGETLLIQVAGSFRTKGVPRTLAAVASLPDQLRRQVKLLILGQGDIPSMQHLARGLGIEAQVIFAGASREVRDWLCAADLMVHPACNEAAGNVLLESIACGTPVLCSGICGFASYVRESGGVVLQEPFRQAELNQKLQDILQSEGFLTELAGVCRNYAGQTDFFRRAAVAADLILETRTEEKCL